MPLFYFNRCRDIDLARPFTAWGEVMQPSPTELERLEKELKRYKCLFRLQGRLKRQYRAALKSELRKKANLQGIVKQMWSEGVASLAAIEAAVDSPKTGVQFQK